MVPDPQFPSSTWTKVFLSVRQHLPVTGGFVQRVEFGAGAWDGGKPGANKGAAGKVPVRTQGNPDLP